MTKITNKMQITQTKSEILVRIAQLKDRYEKLRGICGAINISRDTMESYSNKIAELEKNL